MSNRPLTIIIPSFNDFRIGRAIRSVHRFDDSDSVAILIVDGGSGSDVIQLIQEALNPADRLISEPDRGIFDALNKGLAECSSEYIGWLGSDDVFTGDVPSSKVVSELRGNDLYIANVAFVKDGRITRITHAVLAAKGLMAIGLHNPHYATFGRARLLKSEKFRIDMRAADIEYFARIFRRRPQIAWENTIATLQAEGGYSNSSIAGILRANWESVGVFSNYTNWCVGPLAVIVKLTYKAMLLCYFKMVRRTVTSTYLKII